MYGNGQSNLNNEINHVMTKLQKNIIKVLLIRIILISTIISAQIRLFFLFVHDEQNEVLSINNKKNYKFHTFGTESF